MVGRAESNFYWKGQIGNVGVWNTSLTQAQIQSSMNRQLTGTEAGLMGYWTFAEGSGNTTIDRTSDGNNGILGDGVSANEPAWVSITPSAINLQGGAISGTGTIYGNLTNAGEMDLGSSPGTLTVYGNYTQTAAGALSLKVGGTVAGSQFDQLNIADTATLGGTLNVSLINGFGPIVPETFSVLTAASVSASFATTNLPTIDGQPAFSVQDTATSVNLVAAATVPDLSVKGSSIAAVNTQTPPTATGITGQNITVSYTVQNLSPGAATGNWTDSVYLSATTMLDASALLLGRFSHTGGLAGLSSYNGMLTVPLPGVVNSNYYLIVVTDSQMVVSDSNRANNIAASATTLPVSTQLLSLGTPVSATIMNGQDIYYRFVLPAGADVNVTANYAVQDEAAIAVGAGTVPTTSMFAQANLDPTDQNPQILLNQVQGGDYYLLLAGLAGAGSGQTFTIEATLRQFELDAISLTQGSNQGPVTMQLSGSHFTPGTTVRLLSVGGTLVPASPVTYVDSNDLTATFDLTGVSLGNYDVQAQDGGKTSTAPQTFQVIAGIKGFLSVVIISPAKVHIGSPISVTVNAINGGDTDVPAPILQISASNIAAGQLNPQPVTSFGLGSIESVIPADQTIPYGIVYIPSPKAAHVISTFQLQGITNPSTVPIDWNRRK